MERTIGRGSLLLRGGYEAGHKGFGLALMVQALTQGLSGYARRDGPSRWGASVYRQLIDPAAFAGRDEFVAQMDLFVEQCHVNPPLEPARPVRLPGEQASRIIVAAQAGGIGLSPATFGGLNDWANKLGVDRLSTDEKRKREKPR